MRSEAAWSYLDPRPICLYDPKYNAHLVYWNGVALTRTYALIIIETVWMNIYPTDHQRQVAWNEYQRIYRSGGFQTRSWDKIIDNQDYYQFYRKFIQYICAKNTKFFSNLKEQYDAKTALSWFLPGKELTIRQ